MGTDYLHPKFVNCLWFKLNRELNQPKEVKLTVPLKTVIIIFRKQQMC